MTYTSGGLIQATDYNDFSGQGATLLTTNNINRVWGTGSATFGYGQNNSLTPIPAVIGGSTIVTAAQWTALNNTLSAAANHQGTPITSRTNPVIGDVISTLAALQTDINSINTSRGNAAAVGPQYGVWTGPVAQTGGAGSGSAAWTITWTTRINFPTVEQANWFFNAGGLIKWQVQKTSTGTVADLAWNPFVNSGVGDIYISGSGALGTQTIGGTAYTGVTKIGGSISPSAFQPTLGYYNLTSTPQTIYQVSDNVSPYSGNTVRIQAYMNGPVQLVLSTVWSSSGGAGIGSTNQISGGSDTPSPNTSIVGSAPTTLVTYINPEQTYLTNSWGTPTIACDPIQLT